MPPKRKAVPWQAIPFCSAASLSVSWREPPARFCRHAEERLVRRSSTSEGGSDEAIHSFFRLDGLLRGACHRAALCADPLARNDEEIPSLGGRQMTDLVGDLLGNRCCPWRAATALHIDFHPEGFPASGRPDAVHGRRALDALRMRGV